MATVIHFKLLGLFALGVLAHQVVKWSAWKTGNGGLALRAYWQANARAIIGALASDVVLVALYVTGGAEVVVRQAVAWANPNLAESVDLAFMHVVAPLAGWVSDSVGRNLLTAFSRKAGEKIGAEVPAAESAGDK
jgi:hypothetical protein